MARASLSTEEGSCLREWSALWGGCKGVRLIPLFWGLSFLFWPLSSHAPSSCLAETIMTSQAHPLCRRFLPLMTITCVHPRSCVGRGPANSGHYSVTDHKSRRRRLSPAVKDFLTTQFLPRNSPRYRTIFTCKCLFSVRREVRWPPGGLFVVIRSSPTSIHLSQSSEEMTDAYLAKRIRVTSYSC